MPCFQLFDLWSSDPNETPLNEVLEGTARLIPDLIFPGGSFCCKGRLTLKEPHSSCNQTEFWSEGPTPCQDYQKVSAFIPGQTTSRWSENSGSKEPQLLASIGMLELFYNTDAAPPTEHSQKLQDIATRLGKVLGQRLKLQDLKGELANAKVATRRLAQSLQLAKVGQWELDLTSNKLEWSEEIYRLFQVNPQKFGASYEAFLNAIHPDDREFVNAAYTNSLVTKRPYNIVHRLLYADGSIRWVQEVCRTEFHPVTGKPLYSVGTVQDVSNTKDRGSVPSTEELSPDSMACRWDSEIANQSSHRRHQSKSPQASLPPPPFLDEAAEDFYLPPSNSDMSLNSKKSLASYRSASRLKPIRSSNSDMSLNSKKSFCSKPQRSVSPIRNMQNQTFPQRSASPKRETPIRPMRASSPPPKRSVSPTPNDPNLKSPIRPKRAMSPIPQRSVSPPVSPSSLIGSSVSFGEEKESPSPTETTYCSSLNNTLHTAPVVATGA